MASDELSLGGPPRFVCDVHLGKLASHIRMFGFDTVYKTGFKEGELMDISIREGRVLLSKDRKLLARTLVSHCFFVKEIKPRLQLLEVIRQFGLLDSMSPFSRCIDCNTILKTVKKETITDRIPERVKSWCEEYQLCETCDRIYWKGSHYVHMQAFIDGVIQQLRPLSFK